MGRCFLIDLAAIEHYLGITAAPVFCTKIASKLVRTYTDRHGLKNLVEELLGENISKQQQSSDWGGPVLSDAQQEYAASDVRHLHAMRAAHHQANLVHRQPLRRSGAGLRAAIPSGRGAGGPKVRRRYWPRCPSCTAGAQ